ncbi:sigma-70 family RNA polymerase sigma factor [Aggregicoccus sp. 17bor-14]|uniref:sigma-70 family RNA polymerase sigma factor n=1 Tax=Myxococcaceae TaxID=31 RepID=UPI00129C655A|nr:MULTISPECIES: sigma-70 family RNA polymerase sigma factor [Myxococcaceae]MBF5043870.1 sigma-70 family RNA polymerase sigma factor [Simulacricoccus sp. 17bor-14]MRI89622.1 sigma-70 family RNA polymerase sigma factor [Aggregicoccus sp. 17bor-14]
MKSAEQRPHARHLWGLLYRMTGVAADADELLQETYLRALEHPPQGEPRPYLTRVALNLARDRLRRRRREGYVGPWLPSPLPTEEEVPPGVEARLADGASTEARYELLESVSWAFLLALEALLPVQRAVLLLRDVFDQEVGEVAEALGLSEGNVRVIHHRAHARMAAYDAAREPLVGARQRASREALEGFLTALAQGDVEAARSLLAEDVVVLQDGGGVVNAARVPLVGPERALLFFQRITALRGLPESFAWRELNGLPALVMRWTQPATLATYPTRAVTAVQVDAKGRIRRLWSQMAPRKLEGSGDLFAP